MRAVRHMRRGGRRLTAAPMCHASQGWQFTVALVCLASPGLRFRPCTRHSSPPQQCPCPPPPAKGSRSQALLPGSGVPVGSRQVPVSSRHVPWSSNHLPCSRRGVPGSARGRDHSVTRVPLSVAKGLCCACEARHRARRMPRSPSKPVRSGRGLPPSRRGVPGCARRRGISVTQVPFSRAMLPCSACKARHCARCVPCSARDWLYSGRGLPHLRRGVPGCAGDRDPSTAQMPPSLEDVPRSACKPYQCARRAPRFPGHRVHSGRGLPPSRRRAPCSAGGLDVRWERAARMRRPAARARAQGYYGECDDDLDEEPKNDRQGGKDPAVQAALGIMGEHRPTEVHANRTQFAEGAPRQRHAGSESSGPCG
jgi:hypothetical protein